MRKEEEHVGWKKQGLCPLLVYNHRKIARRLKHNLALPKDTGKNSHGHTHCIFCQKRVLVLSARCMWRSRLWGGVKRWQISIDRWWRQWMTYLLPFNEPWAIFLEPSAINTLPDSMMYTPTLLTWPSCSNTSPGVHLSTIAFSSTRRRCDSVKYLNGLWEADGDCVICQKELIERGWKMRDRTHGHTQNDAYAMQTQNFLHRKKKKKIGIVKNHNTYCA